VSHAGSLLPIGQFSFLKDWNTKVFSSAPYSTNTNNRTYNVNILSLQIATMRTSSMSFLTIFFDDWSFTRNSLGILAMGVNSSSSYNIVNANFFNPT
ncbi:hypothetical protein DFS33DRAFT_1227796, partial [Desarmillaria ectypa]